MNDEKWMKQVLRLAARGKGRTSPNPMVGAIVVKEGRAIGKGYHARAGEAHAERVALEKAGVDARGSSLYLNLEPCTHYGKTPPCAPFVIESGVREVVIGMEDPNPLVKGRGIEALRKAGIEVRLGILETESKKLNEAFCKYILNKKPFVILKAAATLDGKIATRSGDSQWISHETSRDLVHKLREEVDGVVVGIGTVIKDDPLLTARSRRGRDPYRIVLDSKLRIPENAQVIGASPSRTIVVTTEVAPRDKVERLEKRGVQVLILEAVQGRVDLKTCLSKLGEMGMMSLLVEGGSGVNGSFLDQGIVDKFMLFLSPRFVGDPEALGIFSGRGVENLKEATHLKEVKVRRVDIDILVEGYVDT